MSQSKQSIAILLAEKAKGQSPAPKTIKVANDLPKLPAIGKEPKFPSLRKKLGF